MIASLPMYARRSNRAAHDTLWALIRDRLRAQGIAAPDMLDHDIHHVASWQRPDLVLGQICNLPYRAQFRDKVTLIGAADHGLTDCAPGYYNSVFVVHHDTPGTTPQDFANARFACNDMMSQSGYGAPQTWAEARGFRFAAPMVTGSHHESIATVATGQADIAAIDAQTWWIEARENPALQHLRIIAQTHSTPGQSFITRAGQNPAPYFTAIAGAIRAAPAAVRTSLNLRGIVALPQITYDLPLPPKIKAIAD